MRACFQSKSFFISFKIFILSFLLLLSTHASGFDSFDIADDDDELHKKTFERKFIDSNIEISKWFDNLTEGIDLFLVGEQLNSEKNQSSVKLENTTFSKEGTAPSNQTTIIINPRFPNLEKYWNLKFTSYNEQDERGAKNKLIRQSPRETNYGATIGVFKSVGKIRTSFQPRIGLQDPLVISHSLVFESTLDLNHFQINPKLNLFADATNGTGLFQAINFNFVLTNTFSLTLINDGTYFEKTHKYTTTNGVSLGQSISNINAMSYSLLFFSNNRDNYHLDSYVLSTSWYHLIYKKILDLQLTPHLEFTSLRGYKGQAGISLQLTLNF
ncbi:MAG: hypothetical protein AABY53_06015 [Bdellovibrionota bacterium]